MCRFDAMKNLLQGLAFCFSVVLRLELLIRQRVSETVLDYWSSLQCNVAESVIDKETAFSFQTCLH